MTETKHRLDIPHIHNVLTLSKAVLDIRKQTNLHTGSSIPKPGAFKIPNKCFVPLKLPTAMRAIRETSR
jgi:hypothetical protein